MIKNCFCIKPQAFNLEDMNVQIRHWFGTVGWFVQLLGGCFRQESDYPTFYHLAVLDYKPCYSQEPWLPILQLMLQLNLAIIYKRYHKVYYKATFTSRFYVI